jgi:hypothetical protein
MKVATKPKVFISYTWRKDDPNNPDEDPEGRALKLADQLRAVGFDCRLDKYFRKAQHGFVPPERRQGDTLEPWITWAKEQIREADFVLVICSREYTHAVHHSLAEGELKWDDWHAMSYEDKIQLQQTSGKKVPYSWWDLHFMVQELESGLAESQKFIPVGFGSHSSNSANIPSFVEGANYYDLNSSEDFEGLLRRIKLQFRQRHPRQGVFISYSHEDDEQWLDPLLTHLEFLKQSDVEIWTDRDIKPGSRWRVDIENALASARVAVLIVTPAFLASPFIRDNELPPLLRAAESDGLIIFWIPAEPSSVKQYEIIEFQAAHPESKPLSELKGAKRGKAFVSIAEKLAQTLGVSKA